MDDARIRGFFLAYSLIPQTLHAPQKGYRNTSYSATLDDTRHVNFILYKSEPGILPRIKRTNGVSQVLARTGLPVRYPIDDRILKIKSSTKTIYGSLYNYLPGNTIPWEGYTKAHIKLVGMAMSALHHELKEVTGVDNKVTDEYEAILSRVKVYLKDTGVEQVMQKKLGLTASIPFHRFRGLLDICETLPDKQVLHMDFVRGNLLFDTAKPDDLFVIDSLALSGIIDFEKVAYGHPLFDIARTLAFLLVDCSNKTPTQVKNYFLKSGYDKRGKARFTNSIILHKNTKIDMLEEMVTLFLVYDFYKFLRHNPYESLGENYHFVRTRNILIQRKMLQYI